MKTELLAQVLATILVAVSMPLACASTEGDGSESHFVECKTDDDCAARQPHQSCVDGLCISQSPLDGTGAISGTSRKPDGGGMTDAALTSGGTGAMGSLDGSAGSGSSGGSPQADAGLDGGANVPDASEPEASTDATNPMNDAGDGQAPPLTVDADAEPWCGSLGPITELDLPVPDGGQSYPSDLIEGPDGNIWVTTMVIGGLSSTAEVVRVTPEGVMTSFPVPMAGAITVGSDGNFWIAGSTTVVRMTPQGDVTSFDVPSERPGGYGLPDIVAGPDGALWFTEWDDNQIARVTTDGVITEFTLPFPTVVMPDDPEVVGAFAITTGPDGNLWFTEHAVSKVGKITTAGEITEYPLDAWVYSRYPRDIMTGGDGYLWVAEDGSGTITRVAPADGSLLPAIPLFGDTMAYPAHLTWGLDGNAWVAGAPSEKIARVTPEGVSTACALQGPCCEAPFPTSITTASSGAIWFTERMWGRVGFIVPSVP